MNQILFDSPIGPLHISTQGSYVTKIKWATLSSEECMPSSEKFTRHVSEQLHSYFWNANVNWSVPLIMAGTEFQQRVWSYLKTIPAGETQTYSEVADALNSSARAVGNACRANPFVIIIPCHRVVSKTGLGGYDGQTDGNNIRIKQWLLEHERR